MKQKEREQIVADLINKEIMTPERFIKVQTEEQKKERYNESLKQIKKIVERFNFNPNLIKEFEKGNIYCSDGNRMYNINTNQEYAEIVSNFEKEDNALVYHCVLTEKKLVMLYTSKYKDIEYGWDFENLTDDNYIFVESYYFKEKKSFFGYAVLSSNDGALVIL